MTSIYPLSEPESTAAPETFAEPEATPEPEVSVEPEYEPEPSSERNAPEPENEPRPEAEVFAESEPMSEYWPEPGPEWSKAYGEWGVGWHLHVYTIGIIYLIFLIFGIIMLCSYLFKHKQSKKGNLTSSLLTMSIIFTLCRTITMFGDPYSSSGNFHPIFSRLLWTLPIPFLLSSFSLLLLVLLDTTKFHLGPPRFQRLSTIIVFTFFHFTLVLVSDLLVYYIPSSKAMLVLCQGLFVLYGFLLSVGFLYTGIKIRSNCAAGLVADNQATLLSLIKICFTSAVIGAAIVVTHAYSSVSVFGVYSDKAYIDSWPWWGLQTALRLEELSESAIVLLVASRSAVSRSDMLSKCFRCCDRTSSTRVSPMSITVRQATTTVNDVNLSCTSFRMRDESF